MEKTRRILKITVFSIIISFFIFSIIMIGCSKKRTKTAEDAMLDPLTIPQFVEQLVIPPIMPYVNKTTEYTEYYIAVRQFTQQVLPSDYPSTTVWGYGKDGESSTFSYPAFTVETRANERVRVKWKNSLINNEGNYLSHLLPVDPTLHWANPPLPCGIESESEYSIQPAKYTGPVPIVTHVHGAHVADTSDGYPEAWYLPDAKDIPPGYCAKGSHYGTVIPTDQGSAIFEYPNDQNATTLWYHDHTLGMTRLNVYAGLAGFWIIRDNTEDSLNLPGTAPRLNDPAGTKYYEIPIVIQDRSFKKNGSLFYPESRKFFDEYEGPYIPDSPVPPVWNPEFFGDTIVVNGKTWPYLEIEPRLYRFRFLNGSNSRFLILKFNKDNLVFNLIGIEGGLISEKPLVLDRLLLAPAERADVIVDFSNLAAGEEIMLLNLGPDEPYKGPDVPLDPANPETTGRIMKFKVVASSGAQSGSIPPSLPSIPPLSTTLPPRDLTLNEIIYPDADIPIEAELGTGSDGPLSWDHQITENPMLGDTETWRIINLTEDAHPIHLHLVMFQVVDRIPFDKDGYTTAQELWLKGEGPKPNIESFFTGSSIPANDWEKGRKDTVIANPGEVTKLMATFDLAGLYVWHCHILEHEDNEMMRPYRVSAP